MTARLPLGLAAAALLAGGPSSEPQQKRSRWVRRPKQENKKAAAQYRRRKAEWNRKRRWVGTKGSQAQHTARRARESGLVQ